ncbi:hypothetical protein [Sediminicurvatus halobius]|uniref:Uncharacterized protein n=1 Tax=Sediminicurvatus halobius TaxID=2182432 RepID=A0A2U2N0U6_9GAMM|nr:hypothetical protein [Spiribacter halobius]PWG62871.1 hypothetical protein DEM34_10925 [Spiribacter halobius]UEX76976.1 hypothetical protein LMH63_13620 [Spiribacter halobius]
MYGYPKTISTRYDVEYLVSFLGTPWATEDNKRRGLAFLRGLKERQKAYTFDRTLAESEEPDGPEPEYLVLTDEEGIRRQHRLTDDPNALIHRLGFTEAEVDDLIATVESS